MWTADAEPPLESDAGVDGRENTFTGLVWVGDDTPLQHRGWEGGMKQEAEQRC